MGGIEAIAVLGIMAFCLISGYLLGYVQRMLPAIEEMVKLLRESREYLHSLAKTTNEISSLPPGVYAPGEPDPITGLTRLVPLRDDRRSS